MSQQVPGAMMALRSCKSCQLMLSAKKPPYRGNGLFVHNKCVKTQAAARCGLLLTVEAITCRLEASQQVLQVMCLRQLPDLPVIARTKSAVCCESLLSWTHRFHIYKFPATLCHSNLASVTMSLGNLHCLSQCHCSVPGCSGKLS